MLKVTKSCCIALTAILATTPLTECDRRIEALDATLDALVEGGVQASEPAKANLKPEGEIWGAALQTLTNDQQSKLNHLAFPQSYEAMTNVFGSPDFRTQESDFFKLSNGKWAKVQYDGRTATALTYVDSPE